MSEEAPAPRQLALFDPPPAEEVGAAPPDQALFAELQRLSGGRFRSLVLTDNRRRILSTRPAKDDSAALDLRLHRLFLGAPTEVLAAVVRFATSRVRGAAEKHALAVLRRHFEKRRNTEGLPEAPPTRRRLTLRPVGATLDLRQVCEELNRRFFAGRLDVRITWSQGRAARGVALRKRRRRRSIRLGSWHEDDRLVCIHPALDRPCVPRYVVEAIVFHELLHADLPAQRVNGRRRIHTPEFRRRERLFPRHEQAQRWIAENLDRLLRV